MRPTMWSNKFKLPVAAWNVRTMLDRQEPNGGEQCVPE